MKYLSDIIEDINKCIHLLSLDGVNGKAQARAKLSTCVNDLNEILSECNIEYPLDELELCFIADMYEEDLDV